MLTRLDIPAREARERRAPGGIPYPEPPREGQIAVERKHIAWMLGVDTGWVYRQLPHMIAQLGFPKPLRLGRGTQDRWSREAIEEWARSADAGAAVGRSKAQHEADLDRKLAERARQQAAAARERMDAR